MKLSLECFANIVKIQQSVLKEKKTTPKKLQLTMILPFSSLSKYWSLNMWEDPSAAIFPPLLYQEKNQYSKNSFQITVLEAIAVALHYLST